MKRILYKIDRIKFYELLNSIGKGNPMNLEWQS